MKRLLVWTVIVFSAILIVTACGGAGGGGGGGQSAAIHINEFDNASVDPLAKLTITGSGFDPAADLTVGFFDDADFSIDVPVLEATASSITVMVPPYINSSTGQFEPGTVNVQVVRNSATGAVASNIVSGLQVGALPALSLSPGDVTANVAAFLELSLTDTMDLLAELDALTAGQVDTVELCAQLEAARLLYGQLKDSVRHAIADPDQAETIGEINGVPISLDQESLRTADQLMVALIDGILAELQITPSLAQHRADKAAGLFTARAVASVSSICETNPQLCSSAGEPLLTVRNTRTGEVTAVAQYHYALALPGASEVLGNLMTWFGAASATVGAVAATAGVSVPIVAVAAITSVNVNAMVAKFGLDAARLTADADDKEAAKDLRDDFNGTLAFMSDAVLSPAIAAASKKAGIVYDLFTGWNPVMDFEIPAFLSDLQNFLDTPPPVVTGDVTGYWIGTINNPNLGTYGCNGGLSSFSVSLSEDAGSISGSYSSVPVSGSRSGYSLSIDADTSFGNRSYSWTWDGADTLTGSVAYFCWSDDTGALLSEGSGTFTVTR